MKKAGVEQAAKALAKAKRSHERLRRAKTIEEAEDAWEDFLNAAHRLYEKLKSGSRGHSDTWAWFGGVQDMRRDDPLLQYIHQARNADHHRLEEVVDKRPPGWGLQPNGHVRINHFAYSPGVGFFSDVTPMHKGARLQIKQYAASLTCVDVTNYDQIYPAPSTHKGSALSDHSALTVATLALAYFEGLVVEASSRIR